MKKLLNYKKFIKKLLNGNNYKIINRNSVNLLMKQKNIKLNKNKKNI